MTKRELYATRWGLKTFTATVVATALIGVPPLGAQQDGPCAVCVAVVIAPGQALLLPEALNSLDILIELEPGEGMAAAAALSDISARGGRPGLLVSGAASRSIPEAVLAAAALLMIDSSRAAAGETFDAQVFAMKTAVTRARAAAPRLQVGVMGSPAALRPLLDAGLHAYVDFIAWQGRPPADAPPKAAWLSSPAGVSVIDDLGAAIDTTRGSGAVRWLYRAPAEVDRAQVALHVLAAAARLLPEGLVAVGGANVTCGGRPATSYLNPTSLETVAIARHCPPDAAVTADPAEPGIERLTLPTGDAIIRVPAPAVSDRFAEGIDVLAAAHLTVEEIVARHQAAAARQAAAIRTSIARGSLTLTFEAPGFPAPVTISSQTTIYAGDGRTDLEQRAVRVNGVAFGGGVPRLPIIEPERVASPPLEIALTDAYRYRLAGRDAVAGVPAYVVAFEPIQRDRPLFRGKVWIAADTFAMIKVAAAQTGLRGPIVASEQVDEFRAQADGLWLLARSDVRQTYEGAAHRTPIHRLLVVERYDINPPDFAARRDAAYRARDNVMLRDTPAGYRYLQKPAGSAAPSPSAPVDPALAAPADRVRTLAAGVIVDPNITTPLPFAGVSYVDFNLFGTGTQFNAFFGGSYGQAAFSVPSFGGGGWQLAGRAFGIASAYHDRAFVGGREQYELNIRQRPAAAAVWLLRRLGPRVSIRLGYDLEYTHFSAADSTGPAFVVPADQVVHGARVTLDAQRGGWNASLWWNPARRAGWAPWGTPGLGEYDIAHRDFQRYGASVARSAVLSPRAVVRIEGAAMAGTDLDRFSRYSFGTFDNRLRGYPSALIRFDRGAVLRTAGAWAPGRLARLDVFGDVALVRDPGYGRSVRHYTGVGTAVEMPAPFGTLLSVEWGYGFRGVNADGSLGTHVVRISAFKVF